MLTLHNEFKEKLQQITELSSRVNSNNKQKILDMMKEHLEEIQDLYNRNNDHWAIETADLIVLCYELLIMEDKDIDDIFTRCLPRFDKKLVKLAAEGQNI
jgi:hypothetical protein